MTETARPKVLIADDEYVISRCVSFMLKKEGYDCRTVADGEAALAALHAEPPQLLILDLDMPKKNGFEVCRALRADPALKDIHVLVLTAKGQPITRDWRTRIPADHFMLKPFDPRALLEYVRQLFAPRRSDDSVPGELAAVVGSTTAART
jgi:DNA-binding response OmpR family regulator